MYHLHSLHGQYFKPFSRIDFELVNLCLNYDIVICDQMHLVYIVSSGCGKIKNA